VRWADCSSRRSTYPSSSSRPMSRPRPGATPWEPGPPTSSPKPFDTTEVGLRVLNCLETRRIHLRLDGQRPRARRTDPRAHGRLGGVPPRDPKRLHHEFRDETDEHSERVGMTAALLSRSAGLTSELADLIGQAAPLHEPGKVGVPERRPAEAGKAEPEEFDLVRTTHHIGAQIIGDSKSEVAQPGAGDRRDPSRNGGTARVPRRLKAGHSPARAGGGPKSSLAFLPRHLTVASGSGVFLADWISRRAEATRAAGNPCGTDHLGGEIV